MAIFSRPLMQFFEYNLDIPPLAGLCFTAWIAVFFLFFMPETKGLEHKIIKLDKKYFLKFY